MMLLAMILWTGWSSQILRAEERGSTVKAFQLQGRVLDGSTGKPIEEAHVSILQSALGVWSTDEQGRFAFWIPDNIDKRIRIERERYQAVSLDATYGFVADIRLKPLPPGGGPPNGSSELIPASQSVAPAIITANSGQKVSGVGHRWSPWYRLVVGKAPGGYTIQRVEFWLTGDRACGLWAECRELIRSDNEVSWEFRLQGHDEVGAPRKTFSAGHIRVIYRAP